MEIVDFEDRDEGNWSLEGLRVEQLELERTAALFDITCEMQEMPGTSGGLQGYIAPRFRGYRANLDLITININMIYHMIYSMIYMI